MAVLLRPSSCRLTMIGTCLLLWGLGLPAGCSQATRDAESPSEAGGGSFKEEIMAVGAASDPAGATVAPGDAPGSESSQAAETPAPNDAASNSSSSDASLVAADSQPTQPPASQPAKGKQPPQTVEPKAGGIGLQVNAEQAFQGYSLLAPMRSTTTYLVDMQGRVVHSWASDCTPALTAYLLENGHLLRPGTLPGQGSGGPGAGGRIQEFTWEGDLVWDYRFDDNRYQPHHDIARLPNGNVLLVASERKTAQEAIAVGRRGEAASGLLVVDSILEIKPTGKTTGEIVWQWHAWDHLIQDQDSSKAHFGEVSAHPELVDVNYGEDFMAPMMARPQGLAQLQSLGYVGGSPPPGGASPEKDGGNNDASANAGDPRKPAAGRGAAGGPPGVPMPGPGGDWTHVNAVCYNPELDQIMLSVHSFSEVWIIDHSTTTEEAASHSGGRRGKGGDLLYRWGNPRAYRSGTRADQRLFAQHDAHWIAQGCPAPDI